VTGRQADWFVRLTMRSLALGFAVVGILFLVTPDGVIDTIDDIGDALGSFADGPPTEQKLWLALGFAYMVVIAGIALVVSRDPVRYRPLMLVLAAGKTASSLAAGAFFLDRDVFIYLVNFVVDGSLVPLVLACWVLAGRIEQPAGGVAGATPG
jgi:hypothetical protein